MKGEVLRVLPDRGFGFVSQPGKPDLFFHVRDCSPEMPFDEQLTGRRVEFDVEIDSRSGRDRAVRVRFAN